MEIRNKEDTEVWKDIPGYNGDYQASNFGRIRNVNFGNQWGKFKRKSPLIMKPNKSHTYDMVTIRVRQELFIVLLRLHFLAKTKRLW